MISHEHRLDSHDHDSLLLAIDPERDCPTEEELRLVFSTKPTDPFDVDPTDPTETCDSTRTSSPSIDPKEDPKEDPKKDVSPTREEKRHTRLMRNRETAKLSRDKKRAHHQSMIEELRVSRWQIRDLQCRCLYLENENYRMRLALTGGTNGAPGTPAPSPFPPPTLVRSTHQPTHQTTHRPHHKLV